MVARPLTVVQMLPDLESGGVERGTLEVGKYLCERGHRSIVISAGGRMVAQLESEGSRHLTWKVGVKGPVCLTYVLPLRRLLAAERIDILHLRSRLPAWIGFLAWKSLPQARRPRLVTTFHGFYSVNPYSAVMAKGERVIAISKAVASHIQTAYNIPAAKIALIYRGVDESYFNPASVSRARIQAIRQRFDLGKNVGPVIILPGRISPWKGHDIFFKSLSFIREMPWVALCVGTETAGSRHSLQLRKMVEDLGLTNRITFTGHCDDMPAALMLADVVVSASSREPEAFGRIAIEAQAMGRPVIGTAHGGTLETVLDRRTGWLVPPNDELRLAEALKEAIEDGHQRVRFGNEGHRWVQENFTTRKMCRTTLALYWSLLTKDRPFPPK